ncbi:unnamed protein product [Arabidopsis arenosa]|uniref:Uncharacterized protein n=1 Tax=Arabidopsis arenosa TaxID=38785 RepID=A0A8S2AW71_ARAAE|nr:unnamed protein product [Arabidopsis arenosa]
MGKVNTNRSKKMKEVCGGSGEAKPTGKKQKNEVTSMDKDVSAKQSKKASSQKLEWSEEEEIRVLLGMTDFKAITRKNPFDDMNGAYEFLQEYISVDVDDFVEKMKSLKKKLMGQVRINAKEPSSSEPYDQKSSELLKLIWGYDVESAVEKPKRSKRIIKPKEEKQVMVHEGGKWFENGLIVRKIVSFGVDEDSLKRKWGSVPMEDKNMIDQKWRVLRTKELEYMLQKNKFLNDVFSMMDEAASSS